MNTEKRLLECEVSRLSGLLEMLRSDFKEIADALGCDVKHNAAMLEKIAMLKAEPVTAATVPDGWKLVPVEPTDEMCKAGYEAQDKWPSAQCDNFKERRYSFSQPRYKAMLAAAPAAPEQEV